MDVGDCRAPQVRCAQFACSEPAIYFYAHANVRFCLPSLPRRRGWRGPVVGLLIFIGLGFAATTVMLSTLVGPGRTGPGKSTPYESGMTPIGDTRRRFNVRFYIVAMIYLVFDVGVVFLFPWTSLLAPYSHANPGASSFLLGQMILFRRHPAGGVHVCMAQGCVSVGLSDPPAGINGAIPRMCEMLR